MPLQFQKSPWGTNEKWDANREEKGETKKNPQKKNKLNLWKTFFFAQIFQLSNSLKVKISPNLNK